MSCSIYDFDDTLFITNSRINILNKRREIIKSYTSSEYRDFYDEVKAHLKDGNDIDFSEFDEEEIEEFELIEIMVNDLIKKYHSNSDIYILTSRGTEPEYLQRFIFNTTNILLPLENIITVNNSTIFERIIKTIKNNPLYEKLKASQHISSIKKVLALIMIMKKRYRYVDFFDDDYKNIKAMEDNIDSIKSYYPHTMIHLHHIS